MCAISRCGLAKELLERYLPRSLKRSTYCHSVAPRFHSRQGAGCSCFWGKLSGLRSGARVVRGEAGDAEKVPIASRRPGFRRDRDRNRSFRIPIPISTGPSCSFSCPKWGLASRVFGDLFLQTGPENRHETDTVTDVKTLYVGRSLKTPVRIEADTAP